MASELLENPVIQVSGTATIEPNVEVANLCEVRESQVVTTSLRVAEIFSKQHKHVLEAIRNLDCSDGFRGSNFRLTLKDKELHGSVARQDPFYFITRDGFIFLVMGFTGKTAAKYKEAHELDALSVNAALGLARAIEKTDTSNAGRTRAFECYRTVCQLSPGKTPVFLKAGKLAYDLGRYGEAAEIYSRAVAATPSNIDAIDGLIRSLQKTGGSQKIAAAYQKYRESIKPIKKK